MKKLLLILLCLPMIGFGQNVYIPDANFKSYLVGNSAINTNGDTEIQVSEATTFSGAINCNPSSIQEHTTNKELLKVTDLLGRETKQTNHLLFYIYDDGTVEKRITIE